MSLSPPAAVIAVLQLLRVLLKRLICVGAVQGKSWTPTEEPQKGASKKKPKKIKKTETVVKVNTSEPEGAGTGSAGWSGWCVRVDVTILASNFSLSNRST